MDNEKYGIELELITNKFNQKIQQIKSSFKSIGNENIDMSKNIKIENLTAKIKIAEREVGMLKSQLRELERQRGLLLPWQVDSGKGAQLNKEIDNVIIALDKAKLKSQEFKDQLQKVTTVAPKISEVSKSTTAASLGFDKLITKIKRFGLSLLSIRSIWALVSRASSAYLAQDTELAGKLQSVWAGLGAMLAPIIEGIVNILMKAVKYINIFIKALTGVDLLARASAKSMGGTAKAAKSLNKALAGFDELQNLDTDAGGGTGGVGGGLGAFDNVDIDTTWADRIKAFAEWIKENKEIVISALLGIAGAILAIKMGAGLLMALGIGVAIAGIVYAIQALKDFISDRSFENFGKVLQGIGVAIIGIGIAFGSIPAIIIGAVVLIVGTIVKYWEQIKSFLQGGIDWLKGKSDFIHEVFGDTIGTIYDIIVYDLQLILDWFDTVFKDLKQILGGIIDFISGVFTGDWEKAWKGLADIFKGIAEIIYKTLDTVLQSIKNRVITIGTAVGNAVSGAFRATVNAVLGTIERFLNAPIRAINVLIGTINALPGINLNRLSTFSFPRLDVGTNYVPEDQLAMIHKGEAVVPKKFNSKEYFNGTNDETNSKLEELIEAVREIEINPYTTIRDVGKASLNYINSKSRQLGESVVM